MDEKTFGERLRDLRDEAGLTQPKAAELIGVGFSTLQQHESGKLPSRTFLKKYATYYNVDKDWLLTGRGEKRLEEEAKATPYIKGPGRDYPWGGVFNDDESKAIQRPRGAPKQIADHDTSIKISEALTKTAQVLESGTSYATALHLNIIHFHRAIQAESEIAELRAENKELKARIDRLEEAVEKLIAERMAAQETRKTANASSTK